MGKNARPQNIPKSFPRRYVYVETLLILFPELTDRLGEIPTQVVDGTGAVIYDVLAAADVVSASRPPTSDADDITDGDTAFGDHTDI